MSIERTLKDLRQLSYSDMMLLATELHSRLPRELSVTQLADTLSTLSVQGFDFSAATHLEEETFRRMFNRKRTIAIAKSPAGWLVECTTLPAGKVMHRELRRAVEQLLDQTSTAYLLTNT